MGKVSKKIRNPKKTASRRESSTAARSKVSVNARVQTILRGLHDLYPEATCALKHHDPFQLLIATILSAQSTDETVNKVTPILFAKYPIPQALADADSADVEKIIHPTGFFRQKTKSIQGTSRSIVEQFDGSVPDNMDDLLTLLGVARKTANVVLGTAFGKNDGIVVDTHVGRLATRLGLTSNSKDSKDAQKIETDLMAVVPRDEWTFFSHALIWHGRRVCAARKPNCGGCILKDVCPSAFRVEGSSPAQENQKSKGISKKAARSQRPTK
ncbi:MAG: endonuclease III [Planctomycetes bacterium]|nr:endonuclease III [Planctomycetota bacterium]MBI3834042.1 endonuclease III [Planctomycetota bacterium]